LCTTVLTGSAKLDSVPLVARKDPSLTAEELIERCRRELAGYKRPREVLFVEERDLPRSTTGKILRHEIEKWPAVEGAPHGLAQRPSDTCQGSCLAATSWC
jgi:acyl-CoA synthetase (AMP-forming)/AMP-acid ligase II